MQQVRNDSGETIPAFAAMRVTGVVEVKQETVFTVDQQDTSDGPVLLNGPTPIPVNGYGVIQSGPIVAAYFDTVASPSVGDELGPEDGEWKLTAAGSGWVFLGSLGSEKIGLFRQSGGGGCGAFKSLASRVDGTLQFLAIDESDVCVLIDAEECVTP